MGAATRSQNNKKLKGKGKKTKDEEEDDNEADEDAKVLPTSSVGPEVVNFDFLVN